MMNELTSLGQHESKHFSTWGKKERRKKEKKKKRKKNSTCKKSILVFSFVCAFLGFPFCCVRFDPVTVSFFFLCLFLSVLACSCLPCIRFAFQITCQFSLQIPLAINYNYHQQYYSSNSLRVAISVTAAIPTHMNRVRLT